MNPNIWGPHYWYVFHSIASTYPEYPTEVSRKKYYEFIQNIPIFVPDTSIGDSFANILDEYPVNAYLDTRKSLMKWMHFIHNQINKNLHKPQIGYQESLNLKSEYERKDHKMNLTDRYRITIYRLIITILLLLLIFLYYRSVE